MREFVERRAHQILVVLLLLVVPVLALQNLRFEVLLQSAALDFSGAGLRARVDLLHFDCLIQVVQLFVLRLLRLLQIIFVLLQSFLHHVLEGLGGRLSCLQIWSFLDKEWVA